MTRAELLDENERLRRLLDIARDERDQALKAVHWALGELSGDTFQPRRENDPPYWWRRGLRKRAGL